MPKCGSHKEWIRGAWVIGSNVLIPGLDSTARYRIYSFEQDKTLGVFSGSLLMQSGLPVNIPNRYQAVVLELTKQ